MDLKPTKIPKVSGDQSRYSLVIAVAKHAREISEEAAKKEEILVDKPVDLAVQDMILHPYRILTEDEVLEKKALAAEEAEQTQEPEEE